MILFRYFAIGAALMIGGCAIALPGTVAGVGAITAAENVPSWIQAINAAETGVKILSQSAQIWCFLQMEANARKDSQASVIAGSQCTW